MIRSFAILIGRVRSLSVALSQMVAAVNAGRESGQIHKLSGYSRWPSRYAAECQPLNCPTPNGKPLVCCGREAK